MKGISPFQAIIIAISIIAIIAGVLVFGFADKPGEGKGVVPLTMWGTIDAGIVSEWTAQLHTADIDMSFLTYVQKNPETFNEDFVEALASNTGPDLVLLWQDQILRNENKIYPIPYEIYGERRFKDSFVEESELLLTNKGIIGFPLYIDPLIMYWNRNLFQDARISKAPKYWNEVIDHVPSLTVKDSSFNITQSAIALGDFRNVRNAKEILWTLIMQAGNPVVSRNEEGGLDVTLSGRLGLDYNPSQAALNFYAQFANPARDLYTWNRSLKNDRDLFAAGDLAMYLGFASEVNRIRAQNPNLNFDVALLPQSHNGTRATTYGKMLSVSVVNDGPYISQAASVAGTLSTQIPAEILATLTGLPPARRDSLSNRQTDSFKEITYQSAIQAKAVLEEDADQTTDILQRMIESFVSGKLSVGDTIERAHQELRLLLEN